MYLKSRKPLANTQFQISSQISVELELIAKPKAILYSCHSRNGGLEVPVEWDDLPTSEATWEEADLIKLHLISFHLEDKVSFQNGCISVPQEQGSHWITYHWRSKARKGKATEVVNESITVENENE